MFAYIAAGALMDPAFRGWFSPDFLAAWMRVGHAMRITGAYYVDADAVSQDKLAVRTLENIPSGLDPYSEYFATEAYDEFQQQTSQTFVGIGVSLQIVDGLPAILRVHPGSAAAAGGLQPGDRLLKAGGVSLAGLNIEAVITHVRGAAGTKVELELWRRSAKAPFTQEVERRKSIMPTVSEKRMLDDDTGYLRITQFGSRTAGEIQDALNALTGTGAKRLVLDLRNNPGGLISAAVDTVALFCPKDTVVTTSRGRQRADNHVYRTSKAPCALNLPLAVLVNRDSASASEIVSGALQDLKRALIIGESTHGKGVVQTVYHLGNNDGLKITTARYLLPSGRSIQGVGVQPDIYQPMERQTRILLNLADIWRDMGWADEFALRYGHPPPEDTQLAAARDALSAFN
ncbi:MAG: S41 family peptidase [Puniceicoccales bacterium]|jgi:carboxyl-terminal processing protease|nr:S41 family peptidase [Puniceicoccales bacterium]